MEGQKRLAGATMGIELLIRRLRKKPKGTPSKEK